MRRGFAPSEVREQCLKWAIDHDERFGIWGGMSERERRRYKKSTRNGLEGMVRPVRTLKL